ncbi:membrane peptidoglycan carboxypeptidase [Streptomyces sp. SLBN-118]|uniref:transglycosylase domain-containing protein n=1 Tax=Streptomyces sp. SLBN-118 TaxID=2768454 RepID=UPI001154A07A|nr:transglycosylase domain-containing protein [Streptomyces sp. SLBN-118]TQK42592.1 membrane peptidoglycan carboxypeptidase [Streptomyces sp. SLBN-118]
MSSGPSESAAPADANWRDLLRTTKQARRLARQMRRDARRAMPWWRRMLPTWRMMLSGLLTVLLLCITAFTALYVSVQVPGPNAAALSQSNIYYYADGTELGRTGAVNRASVPLSEISVDVQHAVVAAEDRTFYSNQGVDVRGILRGAWRTVTGKGLQGGSTITQQYVRSYYLTSEQTLGRKVREAVIAIKVNETLSKDAIMAGYLNTSYFGRNAYGVQAAAQAYYGIRASQLNVRQSAYLAALLKAPSVYDVSTATATNRAAAVARWNYVLDGMVELGYLTSGERATMAFPTPKAPRPTPGVVGQAGYLIDIARRYLVDNKIIDDATLATGGWHITTTFVKKYQGAMVNAVKKELRRLPDTRKAKAIRVGAASVDPSTGKILAAYGGADYADQPFNDAIRHDLQAGSTFKPFDLAAALQHRATTQDGHTINPGTRYDGTSRRCVQGLPRGLRYCPPNEDDHDYGRITLRRAMMKSVNAVYAQVGADAGLAGVRRAAIAAGLPSDTPDMSANPALALGVAAPSPLDMAEAYATFDNHGRHIAAWSVQKLVRNNKVYQLPGHEDVQAFSRATADQVTSVLKSVVSPQGTGYLATRLGRPAAGKTGTTDSNLSAWFVGYTPQLTTSVAMFAEDPTTHQRISLGTAAGISRVNGGSYPTRIWTAYMAAALEDRPVQGFQLMAPPETDSSTTAPAHKPTPTAPTRAPSPTPLPGPSTPTVVPPTPTPTPGPGTPTVIPPTPTPSPGPSTPTAVPSTPSEDPGTPSAGPTEQSPPG